MNRLDNDDVLFIQTLYAIHTCSYSCTSKFKVVVASFAACCMRYIYCIKHPRLAPIGSRRACTGVTFCLSPEVEGIQREQGKEGILLHDA